jgi:hypothetical protein
MSDFYSKKILSEFESFHVDIYHSKMKWMSSQSFYIQALWGGTVQNQINALSNIAPYKSNIDAHVRLLTC